MKKKYNLSIVIPSRNEEFLAKTIENILENTGEQTEIIAILDGEWANPPVPQHERVNIIYLPNSIGQRAATNLGVKLSRAKFVCKMDAHIAIDENFDTKMIEGFKQVGDDAMMVPVMRNLHAYDWVCECGERKYQDKGGICDKCGKQMTKDMKWIAKHNPQSVSYCFDKTPHFQYFEAYKHREPFLTDRKTGFTSTMSLQGSCFMCTRQNYWDWEVCDESLGSWGHQGIELALSTWLSKHSVLVNHNTYYAHMFRTKSVNDFGFPYRQPGKEVQKTKRRVEDKFWNFKHPKQKKPVSWLLKRFWPVPGWDQKDLDDLIKKERSSS